MKKILLVVSLVAVMAFLKTAPAYAVECKEGVGGISLSPASEDFNFDGGDIHEGTLKIKNMSASAPASLRVYAAPYSVDENKNKDFTTEKARTQISRWIEFAGADGYAAEATFELAACTEQTVNYRVVVPESVPDGGQYAVIFVENNGNSDGGGIRTVSRAGMLVYGRANGGETIEKAEFGELKIGTSEDAKDSDGNPIKKTVIMAGAEVKNTGNVDVAVIGDLKVENIFGGELYHHTAYDSALPDSAIDVTNVWADTPMIGLFKVTYSLSSPGAETITATQVVFICPTWAGAVLAVLLIIVAMGILSLVDKRRKRKAKYDF